MSATHTITTEITAAEQTQWAEPEVAFHERPMSRTRRAYQRGMVTAEYAVGILAAIALALVLLKVFRDNRIFTVLLQQVTQLIGQIGKSIKP